MELRFVDVEAAAAAILGAIEREISGADQHFRGSPVTRADRDADRGTDVERILIDLVRSEEHTSELQSLMRTSYAVCCLKKQRKNNNTLQDIIILTEHTKC